MGLSLGLKIGLLPTIFLGVGCGGFGGMIGDIWNYALRER